MPTPLLQTDYREDTDLLSFYDDDLNLGSVELKVSSGGRLIKGDDCQYIKLNSLTNNTDCQSGGARGHVLTLIISFRG